MTTQQNPTTTEAPTRTVGVIADPEAIPAALARHLERELSPLLQEQVDGSGGWATEAVLERLPLGDRAMLDLATRRRKEHGWDLVICLTDLVAYADGRPVAADLAVSRGVAVISLPAIGATRVRHNVRQLIIQLVLELMGYGSPAGRRGGRHPQRLRDELRGRFRRVTPDDVALDVRIVASRGPVRLLAGMVRDNQPWSLVFGLRGALTAAFAFSAFWVMNSSIWQLGASLSIWRLAVAGAAAVTAMVLWLIVSHNLWERDDDGAELGREQVTLFNASTVLTLAIGVSCMYVALFLVNLGATYVLIDSDVLARTAAGGADLPSYLGIAWLATSGATVAGALGSGFDDEAAVRQAAFSPRERERRAQLSDGDEEE